MADSRVGKQKRPDWETSRAFVFGRSRAGRIRQNLDGISRNAAQRIGRGVGNSVDLIAWAAVVAIFDAGNGAGNKDVSTESGAGRGDQTGFLLKRTGGTGGTGGIGASDAASDGKKSNAPK